MRKCNVCKEDKELSQFQKNKALPLGYAYTCSKCFNQGRKGKWKRDPKDRHDDYMGYRGKMRERHLIKNYGITAKEYEDMFKKQDGLCLICGKHHTESHKGLYVDHCHDTKVVRGLLCNTCNLAIGLLKHNKTILFNAIKYLG